MAETTPPTGRTDRRVADGVSPGDDRRGGDDGDDVADMGAQQGVTLAGPWADLAVIFGIVHVAALASSLRPAIRASRVHPADSLRDE
jgi:hypothetical protein